MARQNALQKLETLTRERSALDSKMARAITRVRPFVRPLGYDIVKSLKNPRRVRKPLAKATK